MDHTNVRHMQAISYRPVGPSATPDESNITPPRSSHVSARAGQQTEPRKKAGWGKPLRKMDWNICPVEIKGEQRCESKIQKNYCTTVSVMPLSSIPDSMAFQN